MKQIIKLIFVLFCSISATFSQDGFSYKDYDWDKVEKSNDLTESELLKDQITIFEKKTNEFLLMNDNIVNCVLEHKIIRLNSDKGIENNNKFYVSNGGSLEVYLQKARAISPKGKVIELSATDVKVATDENGDPSYQYFAFEGIEKGSVIEYVHIMTFPVNYSGVEVKVQSYYDKKNVTYELICPSHLEFKIKSVNGLPEFKKDTTDDGKTRYAFNVEKIEGLVDESLGAYQAHLQKYYYQLFKNLITGKSNFYNYEDVTKSIYQNMFTPLTSKETKGINKIIKDSKLSDAKDLREKIFLLENYLKRTYVVFDVSFEGSFDITSILKTKMTNDDGLTRIMLNCLRLLDIDFELVLACNRYENKFIEDFQGYNFLKEYMIYIKELDGYFTASIVSKFGFPSSDLVYAKGLFIKEIKLNGLVSSIGEVKEIKGKGMDASVDEIITYAKLMEDNINVEIDIERRTSGYKAAYQSFLDVVSEKQKTEFKEEYLNYIDNETTPTEIVYENDSSIYYGYKPFIGKAKMKSGNFIEQAGDKLLFKVGMLIGPQSDLYNSKERKQEVENECLKKYIRTIKFEIPSNYEVKNLKDLIIDIQPAYNNNAMGFVSSYKIENNVLIITVNEWYNTIIVPVEHYKSYEDVVNAAANFNKIKLVLQKK